MSKMAKKKVKLGMWTTKEVQLLKKEFPNNSCEKVSNKLGRPFYAVKRKAYRLGIYKTKRYLKSIGKA